MGPDEVLDEVIARERRELLNDEVDDTDPFVQQAWRLLDERETAACLRCGRPVPPQPSITACRRQARALAGLSSRNTAPTASASAVVDALAWPALPSGPRVVHEHRTDDGKGAGTSPSPGVLENAAQRRSAASQGDIRVKPSTTIEDGPMKPPPGLNITPQQIATSRTALYLQSPDVQVHHTSDNAPQCSPAFSDDEDVVPCDSSRSLPSSLSAHAPVFQPTAAPSHNSLSSSLSSAHRNSDTYMFYQAADGQFIFLDALCIRGLVAQYGTLSRCPEHLSATIVDMEGHTVTSDTRDRFRFLGHLPLGCEFVTCEVDMSALLAPAALATVQGEIHRRGAQRRRRIAMEMQREKEVGLAMFRLSMC